MTSWQRFWAALIWILILFGILSRAHSVLAIGWVELPDGAAQLQETSAPPTGEETTPTPTPIPQVPVGSNAELVVTAGILVLIVVAGVVWVARRPPPPRAGY
jgi:hypothetical protein